MSRRGHPLDDAGCAIEVRHGPSKRVCRYVLREDSRGVRSVRKFVSLPRRVGRGKAPDPRRGRFAPVTDPQTILDIFNLVG